MDPAKIQGQIVIHIATIASVTYLGLQLPRKL